MKKKVFILIPDGVSLRNFAYTSFYDIGVKKGFDIVFWNNTPFDIEELGFPQITIEDAKPHFLTDILKTARIRIELKLFSKRDKDPIYKEYLFPLSYRSIKSAIKSNLVRFFSILYGNEEGIDKIRNKMFRLERKTDYYQNCKTTLEKEKPDIIFCTSQRPVTSITPLIAAKDLEIPTLAFIFSWDNVPKATTVVTTDYYCVWSELMKNELLHYNRYINKDQIIVTGTPQFEPHFNESLKVSREVFFSRYNLDISKKYICFSGDDITTSPKDELYLRDVAKAFKELNEQGENLGIIFRRCPVDFSDRYNEIIKEYSEIITPILPAWEKKGLGWNTIMPTKKDLFLQVNIIAHTEFVVNLGSSMVFDYATHNKPCAFMNYNYLNSSGIATKEVYVYDFVHFRSMPSQKSVVWLSSPKNMTEDIQDMIQGVPETITSAKQWFKTINMHPPQDASSRIWSNIKKIVYER